MNYIPILSAKERLWRNVVSVKPKRQNESMSTDLYLPRPGAKRMQACKRTRQRRQCRPHHGDPAPMNMNATAQMVTSTQVGCGKQWSTDTELVKEIGDESAVEFQDDRIRYVTVQITTSTWQKLQKRYKELETPYPVPPHTMTNRGHLRDIG